MSKIIFRDFLESINFRHIEPDIKGANHENTQTIRVYVDYDADQDWFEFGIYDFWDEYRRMMLIEKVLRQEILDATVSSFNQNRDLPCIDVYINCQKEGNDD